MRLNSSLLWLRLAWQPKKAKVFCLLSHSDLLDPIRDHLSLKYNKNKVCIKHHLVSSCHCLHGQSLNQCCTGITLVN